MDEYERKAIADELAPNALYKVSADTITALGKRIKSLATPVDLSDAVNLQYFNDHAPVYQFIDVTPVASGTRLSCFLHNYAMNVININ